MKLDEIKVGMGVMVGDHRAVVTEVQTTGATGFAYDTQLPDRQGRKHFFCFDLANVNEDQLGPWSEVRTFQCRNKHCHCHAQSRQGMERTALAMCPNCRAAIDVEYNGRMYQPVEPKHLGDDGIVIDGKPFMPI